MVTNNYKGGLNYSETKTGEGAKRRAIPDSPFKRSENTADTKASLDEEDSTDDMPKRRLFG